MVIWRVLRGTKENWVPTSLSLDTTCQSNREMVRQRGEAGLERGGGEPVILSPGEVMVIWRVLRGTKENWVPTSLSLDTTCQSNREMVRQRGEAGLGRGGGEPVILSPGEVMVIWRVLRGTKENWVPTSLSPDTTCQSNREMVRQRGEAGLGRGGGEPVILSPGEVMVIQRVLRGIKENWVWTSLSPDTTCQSNREMVRQRGRAERGRAVGRTCYSITRRSDGDMKGAERNKRKLSVDLTVTRHHMSIKQRDGKTAG